MNLPIRAQQMCDLEAWMERALALAARGWGRTHPNPMVGALIVENGEVVAEGWHHGAGKPHAEVEALRALGRRPAAGATLVVTLEPCSTQGRTGPCTRAILEAGIGKVVVGATDPNPAHSGRGLDELRAEGVEVVSGVLAERCSDLNLVFNHWIQSRSPLIAVKFALTLDGCLAARGGKSRWITGEASREDVMRWRRLFPAIAVGRGTVEADDPSLTARTADGEWCPLRFVFDSRLALARREKLPKVLSDAHAGRTVLVCAVEEPELEERLLARGVRIWRCPSPTGGVDLARWRTRAALEGIEGVYVESGAALFGGLVRARLPDYLFAYTAPLLLGDPHAHRPLSGLCPEAPDGGLRLTEVRHQTFGCDMLTRGRVNHPHIPL